MSARHRSRRGAGGEEAGLTLIELLVTIVIMATAFEVVVGGFASSILLSDRHRKDTSATTALTSAGEALRSPSTAYSDCATSYPIPPGVAIPQGMTMGAATVVGRWDASSNQFQDPGSSPCTADSGLQLLRVTASYPDRNVSESVDVVKRKP